MVERFERNKLYVNSNRADRIVKCEYVSPRGSALLSFVCKNPAYNYGSTDGQVSRDDFSSGSPENWDEFNLPEIPGETMWGVSFSSDSGRRGMIDRLYPSEAEAVAYTMRNTITPEMRLRRDYQVHPIIIARRQTLEEFVRSVENEEETI